MITALAVAAIPVPENAAAPDGGLSVRADEKKDVHNMADFGYDSKDAEEQLQECRCYTVEDLFCCGYARYFWEAIKIRYPEYCFYVDMEDLYAEN